MSAYGYKRTFWGPLISVRFTPQSRPFSEQALKSANDPIRTFRGLRVSAGGYENQGLLYPRHQALTLWAHCGMDGDIFAVPFNEQAHGTGKSASLAGC